jgi:hypothetical protein
MVNVFRIFLLLKGSVSFHVRPHSGGGPARVKFIAGNCSDGREETSRGLFIHFTCFGFQGDSRVVAVQYDAS